MQRTGCAVLALDVSATKIGVAVSDPSRIRGLPLFTLRRDRLDASGAATRAPRRPRIRAPALTRARAVPTKTILVTRVRKNLQIDEKI